MVKHFKKSDPYYKREEEKYENPVASREFIMAYLEELGRPASESHLRKAFDIEREEQVEGLRRRLNAMERDGQLILNRRGSYALISQLELKRGRVEAKREGYGFVVLDTDEPDVFIGPRQMRSVLNGDRVLVHIIESSGRGRAEGKIVEVIERAHTELVGRYLLKGGIGCVEPQSKRLQCVVVIPSGESLNAKHGEMVVAAITQYPGRSQQAVGKIVAVLGSHLAAGMEIEVALRAHQIPFEWSADVVEALDNFSEVVEATELSGRKDLRQLPFVTIDGEDAKDFDDAVYCCAREKGGWQLYVAIADVSHYLQPATALDEAAFERGNSVYFPGRVVPMLPEILSNGLCSLRPDVDRLVMVCEMGVSAAGKLQRFDFYRAVIHSHARLTYTAVAEFFDGKPLEQKKIADNLSVLFKLYQTLAKQRLIRGAIEFDTTETKIEFDQRGKISKIVPVVRNDAHKLIEECMVLANVATARFLSGHRIPTLYRVHKGPNEEKLSALHDFLRGVGLRLTGGDNPEPADFTNLLNRIKGRPDEALLQTVLLRSLSQAVYMAEVSGHFGLAYEAYTHFTSPIRRYPDVIVHRAIGHLLDHGDVKTFYYGQATLEGVGAHCSQTERRADEATRDATDWLKCEYMSHHVGEQYEGVISSVVSFGIFIELKDVFVEGLVHISALKNDYYHFDAPHHRLIGKRSGISYRLGDNVNVRIANVDLDQRNIDFVLV